ncbi:MAG: hypothetical protein WA949_06015 [Phormidesmis sp.]
MPVEAIGNPPPQADQLKSAIEKQLPDIIASFSRVLQNEFGFEDIRVGGFTVVPTEVATANISCDEDGCSIAGDAES